MERAVIKKITIEKNTHLHLVPMLRMSGTTPLLPQYVFMVWKGRKRAALRHSIKCLGI
jgi:hypothetical protein